MAFGFGIMKDGSLEFTIRFICGPEQVSNGTPSSNRDNYRRKRRISLVCQQCARFPTETVFPAKCFAVWGCQELAIPNIAFCVTQITRLCDVVTFREIYAAVNGTDRAGCNVRGAVASVACRYSASRGPRMLFADGQAPLSGIVRFVW